MKGEVYLLTISFGYVSASYCHRDDECQHQYGDSIGCCKNGYCSECVNAFLLTELLGGAISLSIAITILIIIACCCCAGCPIHKRRFPNHPIYQRTVPSSPLPPQIDTPPPWGVWSAVSGQTFAETVHCLPPAYSSASSPYMPADGQRGYDNTSMTLPTYDDAVKNSKQYATADGGETSSPLPDHQMVAPEPQESAPGCDTS